MEAMHVLRWVIVSRSTPHTQTSNSFGRRRQSRRACRYGEDWYMEKHDSSCEATEEEHQLHIETHRISFQSAMQHQGYMHILDSYGVSRAVW